MFHWPGRIARQRQCLGAPIGCTYMGLSGRWLYELEVRGWWMVHHMWITLLEIIFEPRIMWSHSVFMAWEPTILRFGHAHMLPCTYKPPNTGLKFWYSRKGGPYRSSKDTGGNYWMQVKGGGLRYSILYKIKKEGRKRSILYTNLEPRDLRPDIPSLWFLSRGCCDIFLSVSLLFYCRSCSDSLHASLRSSAS